MNDGNTVCVAESDANSSVDWQLKRLQQSIMRWCPTEHQQSMIDETKALVRESAAEGRRQGLREAGRFVIRQLALMS